MGCAGVFLCSEWGIVRHGSSIGRGCNQGRRCVESMEGWLRVVMRVGALEVDHSDVQVLHAVLQLSQCLYQSTHASWL